MPLFDGWDLLLGPTVDAAIIEMTDPRMSLAQREIERARRDADAMLRVERSRWLEEHRAERSFPCGLVPDRHDIETGMPRLDGLPEHVVPVEVTAAVLLDDVVFIREGADDVVEVGRIPRTAITGIDALDRSGAHIPEPIHETIEPPQLSLLVLTWMNVGVADEDRFAFRSPWLAWRAGRRLMEARKG